MAVTLSWTGCAIGAQEQVPPAGAPLLRAATGATAFVNVNVVPMDTERVLSNQTVVVQDGRIAALGPADKVKVPAMAVRIDGRGKHLIPGLADMHAHIPGVRKQAKWLLGKGSPFAGEGMAEAERMLFLYLAGGVTTVRIMYGWPEVVALRERAEKGALVSPLIYTASTPLYSASPFINSAATLRSPAAAIAFVDSAKAVGYDFIKMYGLRGATFDSLVAAARRVGMPIAGHVPATPTGVEDALRAGYASIEHLGSSLSMYLAEKGDQRSTWEGKKLPADDEAALFTIAAAMERAGAWMTPTILRSVLNARYVRSRSTDRWSELRYVRDTIRKDWQQRQRRADSSAAAQGGRDAAVSVAAYRQMVKALHSAGVRLLLGTDAGTDWVVPGFSAARELEALVQWGLSPYEALATGTRNAAQYFGTLDSTGTVAVGKRADLVLLNGDPLQDIRHTAQLAGVMQGGRWFARDELDRRLASLEGALY